MIGWEDVYKVVVATVPLYVALMLGYGSVRWWRIFSREQCDAINRLVCYFTLPLFTLEFTAHIDPFKMNFPFIAADTISKLIILLVLAVWGKCSSHATWAWSITSFSLCTLTNALVVGVPLIKAMYGNMGVQLVVQSSVVQAIIWLTLLLFVLEFRSNTSSSSSSLILSSTSTIPPPSPRPPLRKLIKLVGLKLAFNPNSYSCVIGISWAFIANRCNLHMPTIIEGSILIMSKAGIGTAMFSMGIFMALQDKLIACGSTLTAFSMLLKFLAGPAAMAIGAIAVGLHGDVLRVAIIQAAVPQSITSFIFAKEYGLHPEILSVAASIPAFTSERELFSASKLLLSTSLSDFDAASCCKMRSLLFWSSLSSAVYSSFLFLIIAMRLNLISLWEYLSMRSWITGCTIFSHSISPCPPEH
ncbi:auxin efflux carrier component 5 [Senna tora]|uniref:Auxin efflux carrier component n=1 Tax=Senna tora TaxID=362788 RepID=A0A834THZ9_9FABA|nr:auxin efflux carrier component 5 [Senna tora]